MSPAERAARQMIQDKKDAEATDKAYARSLRNTEQTIDKAPDSRPSERLSRRIKALLNPNEGPAVDAMGNQTGMKKGGSVGSASKRADGCAQRGKTRGKMV